MKTRTTKTSRISRSFIAYLSRSLALSTLAAFGIGQANAANLDWDPGITGGAALGGAGTWDTTLGNWWDGLANVPWAVASTDTAVFGGLAGGAVVINTGSGISAGALTFNTTGYTVSGNVPADVLTLAGAAPAVTVTNAAHTATISAIIAGTTGLNKAGAGTLVLNGANTFAGGVSITAGTLSVGADAGLGAAANGVTIDGGALQATGIFTSARAVTLGATGGTVDVTTGNNLTLSAALVANANALTKTGAGTLTLGAASTRTGTSLISGGTLVANNVGALGTGDVTVNSGGILQNSHNLATQNWATNVTLDNGSFIHNPGANHQLNFAAGKVLTIGAGGGTVEVSPGALAASKIFLAAGQLGGGGTLTKTGTGVLQLAGANAGFTGSLTINGGTVEFQNVDSLGTVATSITVGAGGDIATGGVANRNTINLLGGTMSANNAAANYTGTVNVANNSTAALRLFQTPATATSFTISGGLSGPANLTATAPAAATLTLSGNNSGFSGAIGTTANATVAVVGKQALGSGGFILNGGGVRVEASDNTGFTAGVPGLNATYYNFGANSGATVRVETRFASQLLALDNGRVATFVDSNINIPNSGSGFQPITYHPGFHVNAGNTQEGVAWSGSINITTAGTYTFTSASDDGSLLYINGVQVVNNDGGHGSPGPTPNGTITLAAGQHSIFLRVANGTGGGAAQLSYNGPDTGAATVLVPNSVLSTGTATGAVDIGPVVTLDAGAATTSALEIFANSSADTLSIGANQTLRLDSPTISSLNVLGATTLTGAGTIQSTSVKLMLDGAIGESVAGTGLTIAGPGGALGAISGNGYIVQFNAANTYTGTTTVTGSQLQLNAAGTSIAGNLTVNAANLDGPMKNVILQQANQIADTATLNLQRGIVDVGANNDTIGTLTVSGGRIMGSGVITPTTALNLTGGIIEAGIGGSLGLTKGGTGTVTLSGNSTYTGVTTINAGALLIGSSNGLGAAGAGNETVVNAGGQLQIQGGSAIGESITITGTGALRNITGMNSIAPALTLGGAASIESNGGNLDLIGGVATGGSALTVQGSGEITITGPVTGGGAITKVGNGTLTFNQNMSSLAGITHTAGALGFNGAQSFGAATVGSGLAYKFNSDPGAGVDVTAAAGGAVIAGYAADQTLLSRVNTASAGALALGVNSGNNLDFSSYPTLGLGASGLATYSGTITPNAAGYRFSGAPASGLTPNVLRLTNALTGTNALTVAGGTLDLAGLNSTQTGAISVTGGTLRIQSNTDLGAAANTVNLNGGTLEYAANSPANTNVWFQLGNVLGGGQRTVNIGAAGGTFAVSSFGYGNTLLGLSGVNPLTGSGTLTKTGFGHLFLNDSTTFSGNIVVANQSANFEMRSKGSLPSVASVEVNQSSNFVVDNQNGWGQRQFSNPTNNQNRVNDAATITLKGGQLLYRSRNAAGQIVETFGTVANPEGQNLVRIEKNGTVGGEILITNFNRPVGGGTVRFEKNGGTFGTAGDNARIFLTNLNGAASTTVNVLGGWAYNTSDFQFVGYDITAGVGLKNSTNTDQGAAAFTPGSTNVLNLNAAGNATLQDAAGNAHNLAALRFGNNAAQSLLFTDGANDVLYVASGGILNDNSNQARTIGSAAQRGKLTAGTSTAAAGPKELFFHVNQNTTSVESIIVDNNGPVSVVKDLGQVLNLNAANTYTGGTNIFAGRINVAVAGGLGSGAVLVKGAALQLNQPGATTAASGVITAKDGSEVYIQNATGLYNTVGDRFVIEGGSGFTGNSQNAGQNLASLTRIDVGAAFSAGGQIKLFPNAVVRTATAFDGDVMTNMIGNLGTNADLYFNQSGGGGANQFITIGQGTPWKGLSSSVGNSGWTQGVINATSDFHLQGLTRVGTNVVLNLSNGAAAGSYSINNISGEPINAFVEGQVALNEDAPVTMSGDITFVVGAGGYLQPNFSNSFGSLAGNLNAKLVVQAGGTVDPGNFVAVGVAANQAQGFAYPAPSPINTNATFEAGGRLLINDASGIGSTTGGATFTMKANSILELGTQQVFLGAGTGGLVNAGQFVYEPGTIVRASADRVFKQDVFVNGEPNGKQTVLEIYGGNRNLTDAVNPQIVVAPGSPTVVPMTLTYGNGGMITNDSVDRGINERRGGLVLENGAVLAATSQTFLNIQENVSIPAGATITIGSSKYVDGNPKTGLVQFTGTASNVLGAGAKIVVSDGSAFGFNGTHTFDDTGAIEIPSAVTALAPVGSIGFNPGNGSTLLINTDNYMEVMGTLTGNGAVIGNVGTPVFAPGYGATSDFTFAGGVRNANTRNPHMVKVGTTTMTLTGLNDTQGILAVAEGEVSVTGPNGKWAGGEFRLSKGGILTFDNTLNAVADRQAATGGGANRWLTTLGGGEFRVLGHATDVADVTMFGIANSAGGHVSYGGNIGGFGKITVAPSGDLTALRTSVTFGTVENFQGAGERNSAWLIRGSGLGSLPGTYDSAGVYTPNVGNPKDGLVFITSPNFTAAGAFGQNGGASGFISGQAGSSVVPTSGLFLGATSATATEGDFITIDIASGANRTGVRVLAASEYANAASVAANTNITTGLNVHATGALNLTGGDTRFQIMKLGNGANANVSGVLPLLNQPSQLIINGGGILVPPGSTAALSASNNGTGADSVIRTIGGVSAYVHAFGDLNVNGEFFSDIGLVKTGSGTSTFAAGSLSNLRGRLAIHEGVVSINDSLSNVRNTGVNAAGFTHSHLELTGGTLNINGNSQGFGRLESGNFLAGAQTAGGTITSAAPATITVQDAGQFDGHITGAISYNKVGNNQHLLHNSNPYTGTTTIRQGGLILRANGTLANTTEVNLNYGRLDIDDGHLAYVNNRVNTSAIINMRGGDLVNRGRAGTLTQQNFGTVNLLQGQNLFQTLAGGGGATETIIGNLVRSAGATASFQQNYGFIGTAGNDTTAIRYILNNVNGAPVSLTNGIIGGWAIVNNDHFATYDSVKGVSFMSNTEDGFRTYDSGDVTVATAIQNVNDGTAARTIAASKTVNSLRLVPGAAQTITLNAGVALTLNTGGLLTQANQAINITGGQLTSNSGELNVFVNQNTTTIASQITGNIALTKTGGATLTLTGNNNYTGLTYFQGNPGSSAPAGTVNLNTAAADGNATVSVPGDLHIHSTTVTELLPNQIKNTATVNLYGSAIFNLRDADATTETLAALSFQHAGGDANNRAIISRAAARPTSALNLTAATPITASNDNPTSTPTISVNVGSVNFARGAGLAQTLQIDSPVGLNGVGAIGLVNNANIGTVPTGVAEGGLIKAGNGLLILGGNGTGQFGNPASVTDVFNIASGIVRIDQPNALGPVTAVTTVQSGAKVLLNNNTGITGSVRLKDGAELSLTLNSSTLGAVGSNGILDIPSGATTTVGVLDYYVPSTNVGNIVVNHQVTGAGTINLRGIEYAAGYNAGGLFQLRNEANTFSGTVNVNSNTVFESSTNGADFTGNAFGAAAINLNGGTLRVRDAGNNLAGAQTISYGTTNVTLTANSYLNFDRINAVANNKTIAMGNLTIPSGSPSLWVNNGNGYIASFAQVDGVGTLVKAGLSQLDINGFAGSFSGNIEVAGPKGLAIQASNNLNLVPSTSNIANLKVGGSHTFAAGKTVNVSGALEISNNAGEIINGLGGITTGANTGAVTLNSTSTVTTGILRNNGIVAANNSASAITATTIAGSGHFHAYGADLTLNGTLANDGANPTTLRTTAALPTNAVILTTATAGTNTGGADVQSGILRIAPTGGVVTNPLGSGGVRVHGAAATALGTGTVPVAAQSAALEFAGTNITQAGTITNTGTIRVTSGTTTLTGIVRGTSAISSSLADFQAATVPGLLEGRLTVTGALPDTNALAGDFTAARVPNPGNFGVKLEPRMAQTNLVTQSGLTGWSDNTAFVYTGYFYDADGVFTFMENQDDNTLISIDGVTRLLNNGGTNPWQTVTSTATAQGQRGGTLDTAVVNTGTPQGLAAIPANPNLPSGWHSIEIRVFNGVGGAGPVAANGFANNYGLGLNPNGTMTLDGTQALRPIDDGTGTLFRTAAAGKGDINLADGTTLNVGRFELTRNVTLNSLGNTTSLNVTAAGASDSESILLAGTTASAIVTLGANATVTTGNLSVAAGGALSLAGDPGSSLTVTTTQLLDGSVTVDSSTLNIQGVGTGTGAVTLNDGVINLTGSISGSVAVNGGILTGNSTSLTTGQILGITDIIGGAVKPGAAAGTTSGLMHFDGGLNFSGGAAAFDLNGTTAGTGYDQLSVVGAVNLGAHVPFTLSLGFAPAPMTSFILVDNDDVDAVAGGFKFSYLGSPLNEGDNFFVGANEFEISYIGGSGNDITTTFIIPEPGSAALLLGGLAMLAGRRRRKQS